MANPISVSIPKDNIYDFVTMVTSHIGKQMNDYDNICCTSDNYPVLDSFINPVIAHTESTLRHYLSSSYETDLSLYDEDVDISIKSDSSVQLNSALTGNFASLIRLSIAYRLIYMWLLGIKPDVANLQLALADNYLLRATTDLSVASLPNAVYTNAATDTKQTADTSSQSTLYVDATVDTKETAAGSSDTTIYIDATKDDMPAHDNWVPRTRDLNGNVMVDSNGNVIVSAKRKNRIINN